MASTATTAELRTAYQRVPLLRLSRFTFERALATPLVRAGLEGMAAAARRRAPHPIQLRLDIEEAMRGGL